MGRKFYTPSKPSNQNLIPGAIPRGDSMVSVFGMGSEACGVSDMEYYSELLNHISENWKDFPTKIGKSVIGLFSSQKDFQFFYT